MNEPVPPAPMVPMHLCRIVLRDGETQQYIHLKERGGERTFAIVIGPNEAAEIQRVVSNHQVARPLTHQLTFIDNSHMLAKTLRLLKVMGSKNNRHTSIIKFAQIVPHGTTDLDIYPGCWFIQNQQLGLMNQSASNH